MVIAVEHSAQYRDTMGAHRKGCYQFSPFPPESSNLALSDWLSSNVNTTRPRPCLNLCTVLYFSIICTFSPLLSFQRQAVRRSLPFYLYFFLHHLLSLLHLCSFRSLCLGMECLPLLYLSSFNLTQLPHLQETIWLCVSV